MPNIYRWNGQKFVEDFTFNDGLTPADLVNEVWSLSEKDALIKYIWEQTFRIKVEASKLKHAKRKLKEYE